MGVWTILLSIVDEKAATSTTEMNLPDTVAHADAVLFAKEIAKLVDAVIDGAVTRIGITQNVDLPASLKSSAAANSDVEEGARFQFRTLGGFYTAMRLPTFKESLINPGSRDVDQTDTDVAAYINGMIAGIDLTGGGGSGIVEPCDKRDDGITALEFAREQFLSSRRR